MTKIETKFLHAGQEPYPSTLALEAIENVDDILGDIDQALKLSQG